MGLVFLLLEGAFAVFYRVFGGAALVALLVVGSLGTLHGLGGRGGVEVRRGGLGVGRGGGQAGYGEGGQPAVRAVWLPKSPADELGRRGRRNRPQAGPQVGLPGEGHCAQPGAHRRGRAQLPRAHHGHHFV
nr:hypothetical protein [Tanacetum cinerariifolium]